MNTFTVHIKTLQYKVSTFFEVQIKSDTTNFFPAEAPRLEWALNQAFTNANIDWVPGTELAWCNKQPIKLVFVSEDHIAKSTDTVG